MRHMYYVTFINNYSQKTCIFFMKMKDEVLTKFMEFKALVENQTRKKINAVRSDDGGEYVSNAFKDLCAKEGIRRELIAPCNPQRNGVIEKKNCNIVGAARPCCTIMDCLCPYGQRQRHATLQYFCKTGVHTRSLDKLHQKRHPDVSHFYSFGTKVYYHVSKIARRSWSPQ